MLKPFGTILSRPHLHEQAVMSGFCQRNSKLNPELFFELLFYTVSRTENSNLSFMCSYLENRYGIGISKQSLDERFNEQCVSFLKSVLCEILQSKLSNVYSTELFSGFHEVRIKDSTKFNVPETLLAAYRGCGGNSDTSKAGISIQYEYDLKSGRIVDLTLTPAVRNDQKDALETVGNVSASDLLIRDMGYFSTAVLETLSKKGAFFLFRLPSSVSVYNDQKERFSFNKLYRQMQQSSINEMVLSVFVGEGRKIPVRLAVRLVPDEIYEQRLREKEKE
ncbi:MAG: IS4 family transposase, partial [Tannerella sp.]|nr:IS4 family transposase [Tannerella sp.]